MYYANNSALKRMPTFAFLSNLRIVRPVANSGGATRYPLNGGVWTGHVLSGARLV
jgi:hypothetical protein